MVYDAHQHKNHLVLPFVERDRIVYSSDFDKDIGDNHLVSFLTPCHYSDVRKDSDQSNNAIHKTRWQSCDLIGDYIF